MAKQVMSSRGELVNMDEIVDKGTRPLNYKEPVSEITPMEAPKASTAINMRGFMPAQSSIAPPEQTKITPVAEATPVVDEVARKDTRSMADMTGLRIKEAKSIKLKPGQKPARGDGAGLAENIANQITSGMKSAHEGAAKSTVLDDLEDGIET
jgi:hypothetical protein